MRYPISKGFVLVLLLSGFFLVACSEQQGSQTQLFAGAEKGQQAPGFTLKDMQGQNVSLVDLKGKVVVLNFWATWCPPCREEMPSMEMLYRKYKDQGLVILAVNVEKNGPQVVQSFLQRNPYSFPILLDETAEIQDLYRVFRFPETFIIDRQGIVVEKVTGAIDWTSGPAFKLISSLLNG